MAEQKAAAKKPSGMAPTSTRTMWKGAITFGLVHIPIALYSATSETDLDFDWLDKRSMDPVGYRRINKKTGKDIAKEDIVKGIEWQDGEYVVLSAEEIAAAYPRTTQTIEIESFVDADEVPFVYLERPYYVAPINKGEKVYALLREALKDTNKVGIAKVVIQTKQHLAVLIPCGPALVLNLLRWGGEIRSFEELKLPPTGKAAGIKATEMNMARQLIKDMSGTWDADNFRDSFRDEIMKLVETKARAGDTEAVEKVEPAAGKTGGADVIDLTELLRRSLQGGKAAQGAAPAKTAASKKAPAKKAAPAKKGTSPVKPRARKAA